jgi:RNAse (barnase) inhibitor barstar
MSASTLARLLAVGPSGLYRLHGDPHDARIRKLCDLKRVRLFRIDARGTRTKRAFLSACAHGMAFPRWFGNNWDALADCLTDLDWATADAYLVVLENVQGLAAAAPPDFHQALEIFEQAASTWAERGVRFQVLLASNAEGGPLPVVATAR